MISQRTKNSTSSSSATRRGGRDRKKIVFAACLVAVMGIMWMRVLLKKGPETAAAATETPAQPQTTTAPKPLEITYVELPKLPGRNDCVTRDIFAAASWDALTSNSEKGPLNITPQSENEIAIRRLAATLRLEAIASGGNPQVLINGKLLSHGDRFTIGEGKLKFECEVVQITESSVTLACANARITLKLAQTNVK